MKKLVLKKINGTECLVAACETGVQSELLETFWKDFKYKFWIDYKKGWIRRPRWRLKTKNLLRPVKIEVVFKDINKKNR